MSSDLLQNRRRIQLMDRIQGSIELTVLRSLPSTVTVKQNNLLFLLNTFYFQVNVCAVLNTWFLSDLSSVCHVYMWEFSHRKPQLSL